MSFDDLAQGVAGTLSGVFGDTFTFERLNTHRSDVRAVIRRDVETVDESGQVLMLDFVVRIAHTDAPIVPQRGDTLSQGFVTYTLGRRLLDNGYAYEFEASR